MTRHVSLLLVLALAIPFAACDSNDPDDPPMMVDTTITATAAATPALSTLVAALQAAELDDDLAGTGPFTVFAPTNSAFDALPDGEVDRLLLPENRAELQSVLTYHVVPGTFRAADLSDGQILTTLEGEQLTVSVSGGTVMVNGATVTTPNVDASNGVVHLIDAVIAFPDDIVGLAVGTASLSTLVTALTTADLVSTLQGDGPFTVFAPNDAAFEGVQENLLGALLGDDAQLTELLTYHVVPGELFAADLSDGQMLTTVQGDMLEVSVTGGRVFVDGSEVIAANINADNGVVHVVEDVLLGPIDIVDAAGLLGYSELAAAATRAGLVDALRGDGPLTVFAPDDDAFDAAGADALTDGQIANVLLYHVVSARALSTDLSNGQTLDTLLDGETLDVLISGGTVTIDGAQSDATVVVPDVVVGNGVIHGVDAVLLPSAF